MKLLKLSVLSVLSVILCVVIVAQDPLVEAYDSLKAGNVERALEICRPLVKEQPDYAAANFLLGKIYFSLGELDSAKKYVDKAIALEPANQEYRTERERMSNFISKLAEAQRLYNDAKYTEAEKVYLEAVQMNPNFADSYYLLGMVYVRLGNYKKAREYFSKAIEMKPEEGKYKKKYEAFVKQLLYEGNQIFSRRDYTGALKKFHDAIDLNPEEPLAYYLSAVVYLKIKDYDKVFEYIDKSLQLNPEYHKAYLVKGKAYFYKGEYQKAIEVYQKALEIKSDYVDAMENLGIAYYKLRKLDEALRYFKEALKYEKDKANIYENIGAILNEQKKYKESIQYLMKAVELDPRDYKSWLRLAQAYNDQGMPQKAKNAAKKALKIKPAWALAYLELGIAERALGNKAAARQAFQMAAKDPRYRKYAEYELKRTQ
ncbi:MAG: tetratricopeptide repeat protein [Candidatus Marinimicrobia bacterium]|nr:tetratricopeptide repeat protein [Candidatus Neomarinimicrobiota bacterium]